MTDQMFKRFETEQFSRTYRPISYFIHECRITGVDAKYILQFIACKIFYVQLISQKIVQTGLGIVN